MGTYYNVAVHTSKNIVKEDLKQKIDVQLKMTNQQMSLYLPSSEITKFNKEDKNKPIKISNDFYKVMIQAQNLSKLTNGAWDGTIRPLYTLWNFNRQGIAAAIPDEKSIKACLTKTGFENIIIKEKFLSKKIAPLTLDLGSIAKGYGVDVVVKLLKGSGFKNFFVDIGGEVYVSGERSLTKKWRIGIAHPDSKFHSSSYKIVKLSDKAIATSGTYRNFFEYKGKTYSHIINPETGWPVDNNIVSVSVIADNCMLADGLATGLLVMGRQKAIALVNSLDNVECLIIIKNKDDNLENFFSKGFETFLMPKKSIVY
jgi:FAD:protein FMN transferase